VARGVVSAVVPAEAGGRAKRRREQPRGADAIYRRAPPDAGGSMPVPLQWRPCTHVLCQVGRWGALVASGGGGAEAAVVTSAVAGVGGGVGGAA